jgi:Flp pilus assembly protein TadG
MFTIMRDYPHKIQWLSRVWGLKVLQFKDMRRRILYAFLAIVVLVAIYFIFFKSKPSETVSNTLVTTEATAASPDTDHDGLADWEEALWGTDARKPDTDSDGVSDGQEVKTNHNPLKPGPNDALPPRATSTSALAGGADGSNGYTFDPNLGDNLTDKLALNLTSNYLLARDQGTLSTEDRQKLLTQLTSDAATLAARAQIYKKGDLRITESTAANASAYKEGLLKAITDSANTVGTSEEDTMEATKVSQKLESLAPLIKVAPVYEKLDKILLAMPVPSALASEHLQLVNNISGAAFGLRVMATKASDPTTLVLGYGAYRNAYLNIRDSILPTLLNKIATLQ